MKGCRTSGPGNTRITPHSVTYSCDILKIMTQHEHYSFLVTVSPRVCDVPVSCKTNENRIQLWAWLDGDPKAV